MTKKLIVGNWKMNGSLDDAKRLIADILNTIYGMPETLEKCDFVVCPPFLHIPAIRHAITTVDMLVFGAQDCSVQTNGPCTGDISASMLKDSLCSYVIVGHSERRSNHGESDDTVAQKVRHIHNAGMIAIVCVGETESQRDKGEQESVVAQQLQRSLPETSNPENTVIAYEPVWAIGTGKVPTMDAIQAMHAFIRQSLSKKFGNSDAVRILYGGSVDPQNARDILACKNVDGCLVGGASLKAESFIAIAQAA
jgi:triosephosphate isomerase